MFQEGGLGKPGVRDGWGRDSMEVKAGEMGQACLPGASNAQ